LFKQLQEAVNANEDGCKFYALHQSRSDAQSYMVLEQYVDEAALESHGKTDYFRSIGAQMGGCMTAASQIELFDSV